MFDTRKIFSIASGADFDQAALEVFRFQAEACTPYREYLELLGIDPAGVETVEQIPFLPIELFKSHRVYSGSLPPQPSVYEQQYDRANSFTALCRRPRYL